MPPGICQRISIGTRRLMKFLVVVKQKKNVDTFLDTIRALIARGHRVSLAVQERHDPRVEQLAAGLTAPDFSLTPGPTVRTDDWAETAPLLRSLSDCLHYQQPRLQGARKLQARTIDKLREELRLRVDDQGGRRRAAPGPAAADRTAARDPGSGRAASSDRSALRHVPPRRAARRAAAVAGRALRLGAGRPGRERETAGDSGRHAALQLGQPEHQGPAAPASGPHVRVERSAAHRGSAAARLSRGSRGGGRRAAVRLLFLAAPADVGGGVPFPAGARSRGPDAALRLLLAVRLGGRAGVRAQVAAGAARGAGGCPRRQRPRAAASRHCAAGTGRAGGAVPLASRAGTPGPGQPSIRRPARPGAAYVGPGDAGAVRVHCPQCRGRRPEHQRRAGSGDRG